MNEGVVTFSAMREKKNWLLWFIVLAMLVIAYLVARGNPLKPRPTQCNYQGTIIKEGGMFVDVENNRTVLCNKGEISYY